MIQNLFIQIFHKLCIIICILILPCYSEKNGRSIDGFCQCPVHSVMHARFSIPVRCINNTRSSVCIPCIFNRSVKQIFSSLYIRDSPSLFSSDRRRHCPLCDQTRPFKSMTRGCTIRLKRIIRFFFIKFQLRSPVFCIMLRDSPVVFFCPADHTPNDPPCSVSVLLQPRSICHSQKSLYRMHICIKASVVIQAGKLCIPRINGQSLIFIPEVFVKYIKSLFQKLFRPRSFRQQCGCGCQNNKRMNVAKLIRQGFSIRSKTRIPSPVFLIL